MAPNPRSSSRARLTPRISCRNGQKLITNINFKFYITMKNLIYSIIALIAAPVLLISCSMDTPYDNINNSPTVLESQASGYHISLETALNNLQSFVSSVETKSPSTDKKISEVIMIKNHGSSISRTSEAENDTASTLLYVVNYEDDQGYAVLSADTRLPADVYAFTEKGHAEEEDFYPSENNDVEFNPLGLIYASAKGHNQFVDTIDKDPFRDIDTVIDVFPQPDHPDGEWVIEKWGPWQDSEIVSARLKTTWGQDSPYNKKIGRSAGCSNTALAQIIAYNEFPATVENMTMPYKRLKLSSSIASKSSLADTVAHLFKAIYDNCDPTPIQDNTLIWPKDIKAYMCKLGYSDVSLYKNNNKFDETRVYNCLKKGYPVFISAKANGFHAHSWVIDEYRVRYRKGEKVGEKTGHIYDTISESKKYLHCNWGWDGYNNGYFYSGIFNSNNPISLTSRSSESDGIYDTYFRIITYSIKKKIYPVIDTFKVAK